MKQKMLAAQVERFGQPLLFKEIDIPTPGPGQVLVTTEACGVCHTDLHAASGDWPLKPALPFTPGHEGIGIVTAPGAGVTSVKEGDRAGVPWLYSACGHCEFCLAAQESVCAGAQFGGYTKDGGFTDTSHGRGCSRRPDRGAFAARIQAGHCDDAQARHLRAGGHPSG